MSSVSPTTNDLIRAMNEHVLDDHNVLSLRYKYGMTRTQCMREIVKEIVNGKLIFSVVRLSVCLSVCLSVGNFGKLTCFRNSVQAVLAAS